MDQLTSFLMICHCLHAYRRAQLSQRSIIHNKHDALCGSADGSECGLLSCSCPLPDSVDMVPLMTVEIMIGKVTQLSYQCITLYNDNATHVISFSIIRIKLLITTLWSSKINLGRYNRKRN